MLQIQYNTIQDEMLEVRKLNCISNALQRVYSASTRRRSSLGRQEEEQHNDSSISNSFADHRQGDSVLHEAIFNEYHYEEQMDDIQRICRESPLPWHVYGISSSIYLISCQNKMTIATEILHARILKL